MKLNTDIATGLLSMVDAVRSILGRIESIGSKGDEEFEDLVATLERLRTGEVAEAATEAPAVEECEPPPTEPESAAAAEQPVAAADDSLEPHNDQAPVAATPARAASSRQNAGHEPDDSDADANGAAHEKSQSVADATVRIDVGLLDKLMNLVGELVLVRSQILQFSKNSEDTGIVAASQRLNLITSELQEGVMKTRMQPIRNAWNKLPRVVRDLSQACHKQVQVKMEGADTELDKTILEAMVEGESSLSLPCVGARSDTYATAEYSRQVSGHFRCGSGQFRVSILQPQTELSGAAN